MACELTKGRGLGGCLTTTGGIKAVYFAQYEDIDWDNTTLASSEMTDLEFVGGSGGSNDELFKYLLKRGAGSLSETVSASTENGTVFYTPSVTIKLHKLSKEDQNELKLLAQNTLLIFVETNAQNTAGKNVIFALGTDNGCTIAAGTNSAGAAMGDFNGYEWTFEANQVYPMVTVADYTTAPFDNNAFNSGSAITITES